MARKRPTTVQAKRTAVRDEKVALAAARPRKKGKTQAVDSYQNFGLNIGLGTNNALSGSQYGISFLTRIRTQLEWIYRGTWIGGVAVNLRAEDMTRAGIELNTTMPPDDVEKLQTKMKRVGAWRGMRDTKKWANLYGGAVGVILIDGQDPSQPLRVETIARNSFKGITVLDRWMVEPTISAGGLVEELGPNLGKPKHYLIRTDSAMLPGNKVHYSRCLRLLGDEMPYWQSVMENLWGTSVYERIYDRLVAFDSATQGIAQTCYKSYVRTYKIEKLRELVTAGGAAYQGLLRYVNMMRMFQGIEGVTLIDGKDDFVAHTPMVQNGMSEALVQFGQQLCGALRVPAVRLFGMSPSGMNSTGESDWRNYYDGVLEDQETDLREFVDLLCRVTAKSEGLELPEGFGFNFTPLWQMTAQQKAEVAARKTTTILETQASGMYGRGTALKELRQQSHETGVHTNITDEDITHAEEEDKMQPPGMESLAGEPEAPGGGSGGEGPEGGGEPPAGGSGGENAGPEVANLQKFRQIRKATNIGSGDRGLREGSPASAEGVPGFPPAPRRSRDAASEGWIDNRFDVQCGAVADKDGHGVYVHHAMPRYSEKVLKKDGRPLDLWLALYHHEMPERDAMIDEGLPYLTAHRKYGTPSERRYVESEGADWSKYTEVMAGELGKIEHLPVRNPPPNPHVDPQTAVCHKLGAKDATHDHAALPLLDIGGLPVLIECRRGEERWPGKRWPADYGYIRRTVSNEGPEEAVDCFVYRRDDDTDMKEFAARPAYVINHFKSDGGFEEHKTFIGYPSASAAIGDYAAAYPEQGRQAAFAFSLPKLREWLDNGDMTRPVMRVA